MDKKSVLSDRKDRNSKKKSISVIPFFFLLIMMMFCVSSCSRQYSSDKLQELDSIIRAKWQESIDTDQKKSFLNVFDELSDFSCISYTCEKEDQYKVTVEVTAPDISSFLRNADDSDFVGFSETDIDAKFEEQIRSAEMKTSEQMVYVIFHGEEASVKFDEGFIDAMYGYAFSEAMQAAMTDENGGIS